MRLSRALLFVGGLVTVAQAQMQQMAAALPACGVSALCSLHDRKCVTGLTTI